MSAKISALGSLTGAGVAQTVDMVPIVDTSVTQTKSILISELSLAQNVLGTEQATTGGSSKSFDIPSWATRITAQIAGVSCTGLSQISIKLNSEGSGYLGAAINAAGVAGNFSSQFDLSGGLDTSNLWSGAAELTLIDRDTNTWMFKSQLGSSNSTASFFKGAGRKSTSSPLSTLNITSPVGAFSAGAVNVLYS